MILKNARHDLASLNMVAKLYLASSFFRAMYFAWPVWYGFATQTITPSQVGIFFTVLGAALFLAEMPTSIIADKYGRKQSGVIGAAMLVVAPLLVFFAQDFLAYLFAAVFIGIGRAFKSGSLESLVYDHKGVSKGDFRKVSAYSSTAAQAGSVIGAAAGGLLFTVHQSLPFIAEAIAALICLVLVLVMQEGGEKQARSTDSHAGHFLRSLGYLLSGRYLQVIVVMGVAMALMLRLCIQFVNEATMIEHGLEPTARGLLVAGASVISLVSLHGLLSRIMHNDRAIILLMGIGTAIAYVLLGLQAASIFFIGYILWSVLKAADSAFIGPLLHDHLPSSHRSTAISGFYALITLITLGGSTAIGWVVEWLQTPRAAYLIFIFVSLAVVVPCAIWLAGHIKNKNNM